MNMILRKTFKGKRIILHFGAVDYFATVYVNGIEVAMHRGGYTPVNINITEYINYDSNYICVLALNNCHNPTQPQGKQSDVLNAHACFFICITGICHNVFI